MEPARSRCGNARNPALDSLGSLLWHITRAEDIAVNAILAERPQVIDGDGWTEQLGIPRRDLGSGMSDDEVDSLTDTVPIDALLDYRAAVGRHTQELLRDLPLAALDEVIDATLLDRVRAAGAFGPNADFVPARWEGKRKEFILLHTVLAHSSMHFGQGDATRKLLGLRTL